jgi:hypothetical protein
MPESNARAAAEKRAGILEKTMESAVLGETEVTFVLTTGDMVLMQINAWHLILSAILRSDPPFNLSKSLEESILTARVKIGDTVFYMDIMKPVELKGDSKNSGK